MAPSRRSSIRRRKDDSIAATPSATAAAADVTPTPTIRNRLHGRLSSPAKMRQVMNVAAAIADCNQSPLAQVAAKFPATTVPSPIDTKNATKNQPINGLSTNSHGTSGTSPSTTDPTLLQQSPTIEHAADDVALMRSYVAHMNMSLIKDNTSKAYDNKRKEFKSFCDLVFPTLTAEMGRYQVNDDKLYKFLFYQVFRSKKKGTKKGEGGLFNAMDYIAVRDKYQAELQIIKNNPEVKLAELADPIDPLGYDQICTYRASIRKLYDEQREAGVNRLLWEEINSPSVRNLMNIVKGRKTRVRKRNYGEKLDGESSPFHNFSQVSEVERAFWLQGCNGVNSRKTFCSLRNRLSFLLNFASILRNESMHLAELSDLRHFIIKRKFDHDPMPVFLMQISTGKTIKSDSPSQFARATRHVDVFRCPIGALALYLLYRFSSTGEFNPSSSMPDFSKNESWFDIKLLCELGADNTKVLKQQSYISDLKSIFQQLGMIAHHIAHFGRVAGPREAEFKELTAETIRILGNWDRDNLDARYSAKIPLQALRVMAGFEKEDGYWLPRGRLVVSEKLLHMIWPWIEAQESLIVDDPEIGSTAKPTALQFLRCLKFLREVIIQDAATMICLLEEESEDGVLVTSSRRLTHNIFQLSIFQSSLFSAYKQEMKQHLTSAASDENDPNRKAIDKCLPGVTKLFADVFGELSKLHREQSTLEKKLEECTTWLDERVNSRLTSMYEQQETKTQLIVKTLSSFFKEGVNGMDVIVNRLVDKSSSDDVTPSYGDATNATMPEDGSLGGSPNDSLVVLQPLVDSEFPNGQSRDGDVDARASSSGNVDRSSTSVADSEELEQVLNRKLSIRCCANTKSYVLIDMYHEYYGLFQFTGIPIIGGFHGLELKFRNRWRVGFQKTPDETFFNRVKGLVKAIADATGVEEGEWNEEVESKCNEWQSIMEKKGLGGTLNYLKTTMVVGKRGTRERRSAPRNAGAE